MVSMILFALLLFGFGAAAVALAVVAASLISLIWDKAGRHDLTVRRWLTFGCGYLAAYTVLWWVSVDFI